MDARWRQAESDKKVLEARLEMLAAAEKGATEAENNGTLVWHDSEFSYSSVFFNVWLRELLYNLLSDNLFYTFLFDDCWRVYVFVSLCREWIFALTVTVWSVFFWFFSFLFSVILLCSRGILRTKLSGRIGESAWWVLHDDWLWLGYSRFWTLYQLNFSICWARTFCWYSGAELTKVQSCFWILNFPFWFSSSRLIEQLRCALKAKDVIIQQVEEEKREAIQETTSGYQKQITQLQAKIKDHGTVETMVQMFLLICFYCNLGTCYKEFYVFG